MLYPVAMEPDESGERSNSETSTDSIAYFCQICFRAFIEPEELEKHLKTHKELEISKSSCKMLATPAGVD